MAQKTVGRTLAWDLSGGKEVVKTLEEARALLDSAKIPYSVAGFTDFTGGTGVELLVEGYAYGFQSGLPLDHYVRNIFPREIAA